MSGFDNYNSLFCTIFKGNNLKLECEGSKDPCTTKGLKHETLNFVAGGTRDQYLTTPIALPFFGGGISQTLTNKGVIDKRGYDIFKTRLFGTGLGYSNGITGTQAKVFNFR